MSEVNKSINNETKKVSDEALEQVSGGTEYSDCYYDALASKERGNPVAPCSRKYSLDCCGMCIRPKK